jgi:hypothetical protein
MLRLFASMAFLKSAHAAGAQNQPMAQDQPPPFVGPASGGATIPPTDLPSGIGNYCIYENLIYSIGSPICVGKTSYVCVPTINNVGFNQRGYWTPRPTDPIFSSRRCASQGMLRRNSRRHSAPRQRQYRRHGIRPPGRRAVQSAKPVVQASCSSHLLLS